MVKLRKIGSSAMKIGKLLTPTLGKRMKMAKRGRPPKSYKYRLGNEMVPGSVYRRYITQQKALGRQRQEAVTMKLIAKGFSGRQLQDLRRRKAMSGPLPITKKQQMSELLGQVDSDLEFKKFLSNNSISPNTQKMLMDLRRVQNKAKSDNIDQQRRNEEKRLVGTAGSLLATPYIFKDYQLDATGVSGDNILSTPSVFKEEAGNSILRTDRPNILQTMYIWIYYWPP